MTIAGIVPGVRKPEDARSCLSCAGTSITILHPSAVTWHKQTCNLVESHLHITCMTCKDTWVEIVRDANPVLLG